MTATGAVRTYRTVALPRERNIGLILAAGTAVISGISVFVNATAVKAVPDPAVFTTLKNLVAVAILFGLAMAVVRPAEVRAISGRDRSMLGAIGRARRGSRVPAVLQRPRDGERPDSGIHP